MTALPTDQLPVRRADALPAGLRGIRARIWSLQSVRWAAAALGLMLAAVVAQLADAPQPLWWTLYLACYLAGGWQSAVSGVQALRDRTLDVDLLMIVAAIGAASIGQVFDGALLIVIFATSGALEDVATARTERSVRGLLDLAPADATLFEDDGTQRVVVAESLRPGDHIVIRPGERISADGIVIDGSSDVDQSSITGEPLPVTKQAGDEVFAGTLNTSGALRVTVTHDPSSTVMARIVAAVEEASATKAARQLFIEKVEQRYSMIVVAATLALFVVPLALGADLRSTLLRAMTFMIVASPCAVVLATMPPLLCAIANASRNGVLVKSAVAMERLADTAVVVLDKTGTLTTGAPQVVQVVTLHGGLSDRVLATAAAAEQFSEHPIGRAIVAEAAARGLVIADATGFTASAGRGVTAIVEGRRVEVLSPVAYGGTSIPAVAEIEAIGATAVVVTVDGQAAGVLGLQDRARPGAAGAVRRLHALTGCSPVLLTGDNPGAAARLAEQLGIEDVRAGLLPEGKAAAVRDLESGCRRVLMVGDGVNDAPAMASAHSSMAMGRCGADLTVDTADVVSVGDDLSAISGVVALSRRARRLVIANLVIAATVITVLVTWDLFGHLPLPLGVAGHEGSTVLVALNGLRLLSRRSWRRARNLS
ncbi:MULTISPECIES: heavy metal translocating P-type ATPase [unclassified Mycolicibacterium]|uniref:heavy metal translocating P-type ATPase n=1 Tax=unclassified Mycolicibacterium TaxID=2636767 RepID=UPI0012DDB05E|nr:MULTISPECIES: heavy metal translocating P-type ATPase [unclassified Mycolicibacterium]MUL85251.1 cadmium-translocating P-type ATPase [Mycolicibacterium sp. CBMA 329]MUL91218.1 cadmium-translocating P-type ATPase [Mycolicibacterium sp. CBMA 331]MUL98113.1 cadmium-translocating P-type ATPase [Mycolicibacterium sp. CBMA 334]MUM25787.1 cadmium-translocating P-type ATPase [Mycolicibacterium sp. CBMA 295]MUM40977.1 cadmium-translocating P-type ATPase [Mycolicibacterium sp. CBMA 247]